jgi:hypothetical protein
MRASRRLMPTAEHLLKDFEYWVQSHLLEKELGGPMDRISDMEELRKGYKSIRLSLETEPQPRRHTTACAHCTIGHGIKTPSSPSYFTLLPTATCN